MDRVNSEGIPRRDLLWALGQRRVVLSARRRGQCLLCRARPVNEAGLCETCYSLLDDAEIRAAERWLSGVGP